MVERTDGRTTLLAQVDPLRCVSCGICAGSCAPMGIGPPGRSGREQLAVARQDILPMLDDDEERIVAICCAKAPRSHIDAVEERGARIHTVPCAGNLHSSVVEIMLRGGARGVMVFHCPPRDCVGREGPRWMHERFYNDREAELQERVDRRRIGVSQMAPGELREAIASYDDFAASLRKLGALEGEPGPEPEFICEPDEPAELVES
jgi:coenzyme F420-reducing hydrogenase delta subunit